MRTLIFWSLLAAFLGADLQAKSTKKSTSINPVTHLPDNPADWVCFKPDEEKTHEASKAWCEANVPNEKDLVWRKTIDFMLEPGEVTDLDKKNAFDFALRGFLRDRIYDHKLDWAHDQEWRLTGPYVGPIGKGESYGVHPAVRVYYSPEMVAWMCSDRTAELSVGAMVIKEMADIDTKLGVEKPDNCMEIKPDDKRLPSSWTVMFKTNHTHDGWYWANPTMTGGGNPPIDDRSAFTDKDAIPKALVERNKNWYPTGYVFSDKDHVNTNVYPYNLYGAACINCHAVAQSELTFSSLENIVSPGLRYKWYPADPEKLQTELRESLHSQILDDAKEEVNKKTQNKPVFSQPLSAINSKFKTYYGDLGVNDFNDAWPLRLPAETFDHQLSHQDDLGQYLTSDQCINCHDATYSNSAQANMLIDKAGSDQKINVSPYGEWRVSPMGLAGRDPIFFSQLQSETNNLPAKDKKCIENTCLHCHGVMGQRQLAIDTPDSNECKDMFPIAPPEGVPFGQPFAKSMVMDWQDNLLQDNPPNNHDAKYGALARDGISCMVCHQISDDGLGTESGYTGNFVVNEPGTVVGPYASDKVVPKPMQNALNITPEYGAQIQNSDMCGSCHNILLPTLNNDGSPHPHTAPNGLVVNATYEQTTHLEWVNSDFSKKDTFESCQDCHMPTDFKVGDTHNDLKGMKIANIESSDFAPTTHRLPDKDITLSPRDTFARHSLHGLNVFLNEMFQQFPVLLGLRQMDYMINSNVQPALITGRDSMIEMARKQTAKVHIKDLTWTESDSDENMLNVAVEIENLTGHFLPSGVGFRRLFVETVAHGKSGEILWASGRTNDLGVILEGGTETPLVTEQGGANQTRYQPHHQVINQQTQAQIYQEIIQDSDGHNTTSFLRRVTDKKDNRIRGKGFDKQFYLDSQSPYIQMLGVLHGEAAKDSDYSDKSKTGSDRFKYEMSLSDDQKAKLSHVTVKLYNQSIPPMYLQDRFSDAQIGPAEKDDIQRLYYLTSHLNTETKTVDGVQPIKNWRFYIDGACLSEEMKACEDN